MKPDDIATAITQALVQGGAQWLISTIVAFLPVLWTATLMFHLGRPYVLRTLRRCGLRLGADIWWMSYLLMRDAVLLITFALSWIFFLPNAVVSAAFPITGPISALLLLAALGVKMSRRVDDDIQAYRLATILIVAGASLYYAPLAFAVEANSQPYLAGFTQFMTSNTNPGVALGIMWVCLVGVIGIAGWLFMRSWVNATQTMQTRLQKKETPTPAPVPVTTTVV